MTQKIFYFIPSSKKKLFLQIFYISICVDGKGHEGYFLWVIAPTRATRGQSWNHFFSSVIITCELRQSYEIKYNFYYSYAVKYFFKFFILTFLLRKYEKKVREFFEELKFEMKGNF
jgi:hypothetical protein